MAEIPVPSALQQAIGSAQQEYAAQNPLATAPAAPVPVAPAMPVAPAAQPLPPSALSSLSTNPGVSGSFSEQLAKNQDQLAAMQPNASAPGAWARNIVGAAQKTFADRAGGVVNAVTTGLAGAGNVGKVPEGSGKLGGAFYGIGKALQGVQAQQNAQQEAKDRQAANLSDREYKHALAMKENIDMFHQQQVAHLLSQESQGKMVATGKQFVDMVTDGPDGAPVLAKDIPYSEIQSKLAQNHLDASSSHFQPTSQVQIGERQNPETGDMEPVFETRYTVLGNRPNPMTPVSADFAKRWNAVFPEQEQISEGTLLPYETLSAKEQQMANYETAQTAIHKQMGDFQMSKEQAELAEDSTPFLMSSGYMNALAHAGGDQHKADAAIASLPADDPLKKAFPNFHQLLVNANGGQKLWDEQTKDLETQRHDLADENEKIASDNLKNMGQNSKIAQGDTTLRGAAYGESLKKASPGDYALVTEVGGGNMPIDNLAYLARAKPGVLEEIALMYPDLNGEKLRSLITANKEFTSGKTGNSLNSANASYSHLQELYRDTTLAALAGGAAGSKRDADILTAAGEYARYLNNGNSPTKDQLEDAKKALDPSIVGSVGDIAAGKIPDPVERKLTAIREIANLLDEKKATSRVQWQSALPDQRFSTPMPGEDPVADAASQWIRNGGKDPAPLPPAQPGFVSVQIPGQPVGHIPYKYLSSFRVIHADARVGNFPMGPPTYLPGEAPISPSATEPTPATVTPAQ